ncbi:MAG: hypothetical protein OXC42_07665 [Gammaproteobacteria bacterium]|nr:hypothetical protein [Gammaproteobacteria bacterium]
MQDQYVGDVGDFAKYGLLRAVSAGKCLGVAWYLHPNAGSDGKHAEYLMRPEEFRHLDEELFDELKRLRSSNDFSVKAVEISGILGNAVFADDLLAITDVKVRDRTDWRCNWFERVENQLSECELVFADPDNGLLPDNSFKSTRKVSAKRIPLTEAMALAQKERPAIFYHHNTRFPGGHYKEISHWMSQLTGCSHAFYWRRWSNRTFFIVNADEEIKSKLKNFARRWGNCGELLKVKNQFVVRESESAHML